MIPNYSQCVMNKTDYACKCSPFFFAAKTEWQREGRSTEVYEQRALGTDGLVTWICSGAIRSDESLYV